VGRGWALNALAAIYGLSAVWAVLSLVVSALMRRYGAYAGAAWFNTLSTSGESEAFSLVPGVIAFIAADSATEPIGTALRPFVRGACGPISPCSL
jgi:hypothetical protein